MTELLKHPVVTGWLKSHPHDLVAGALRSAVDELRRELVKGTGAAGSEVDGLGPLLQRAERLLHEASQPRVRAAINATGIILHTGLGRAVFAREVVDSILPELTGYCTLATDPRTGERVERDELAEGILTELTGAEAATVVNNNAAATMLVLAALASEAEVIVSRGQLIEIGGSFRLPEVMAQSRAKLVEVGATNRTHLRDYERAIGPATAAIMRVHPSNYRIVGFTSEPELKDLAELAHRHNLILIDDLGAGALVPLERFGLPHEPTMGESIAAGADLVLSSGDKLIGASQAGIIVGRKALVARLRKHPLMRAVRVDKTCLMVLERTLGMFRSPERLAEAHPTFRMLSASPEALRRRAEQLAAAVQRDAPALQTEIVPSTAYLGSGSLPTQGLPGFALAVRDPKTGATELAHRLRLDPACVFGRIEDERVLLDLRTVSDAQVPAISAALGRTCG